MDGSRPLRRALSRRPAEREARWCACWVLVGAILCSGVPFAAAQSLYRYTDEAGNVHFVDSPAKVPAAQRSKVQEVGGLGEPGTKVNKVPEASEPAKKAEKIPDAAAAQPASCRLSFRNRRSRVEGTKTIYFGEVVNSGAGIARQVGVALIDYDTADHVMERHEATPIPATLEPRGVASFEIVMKTVERTAIKLNSKYARSTFQTSFVRCD